MLKKSLETYNYEVHCRNCNQYIVLEIPKGVKVEVFTKKESCPNCGCETLD